jgi:Cdc6-like AAA superfamily ATPase
MRTRAQLNAWKEVTAQHRRESAAFAAAIAASRQPQVAPRVDASNAESAASNGPVVAAPASLITPEKKTRKRKHSLSSPSASSSTSPAPPCLPPPAVAAPADISPTERGAKRRPPSSPASTKATKALTIRRTLDYCTAPTTSANAPAATKPDAPTSPRAVLERIASGDDHAPLFVGRAEEQLQIERVFVSPVASSPRSPSAAAAALTRALFVIGPPGTGKSSCVAHVAALHSRADSHVVRLNCSTFASPSALLQAIGGQLAALGVSPPLPPLDHAQQLDAFLTSSLHRTAEPQDCVLVLDEVDHLVRLPSAALQTKAQQLLAFLVRWAYLPNAALRVIGILNGVDMHAQIAAFLAQDPHPTSVVLFPSYSLDELTAILTAYVQMATADAIPVADVVEPRALELIARKVAARDGDARRAVGMLRQCARSSLLTSLAGDDKTEPKRVRLSVRDVLKCTTAAIATQLSVAKQIEQLPRAPKLLLYALTRLAPCETAAVTLRDACDELESLQATHAALAWLPKFRLEDAQQHIGSLECYALVKQTKTTSKAKRMWLATLTSTVAMEALAKAFQDDELLRHLPLQG